MAAGIVVVIFGAAALSSGWRAAHRMSILEPAPVTMVSEPTALASVAASGSVPAGRIEVPSVVGMTLEEAQALLGAGGLAVRALASPAGETTPGAVLEQDPAPGTIVGRDTTITVWYASTSVGSATGGSNDPDAVRRARFVVCIDPGHQEKADLGREPIGPGAKQTTAKCAAPAYGVVTGQSEAEVALEIAFAVRRELEAHGARVVLTRTTNAVDISNAERARIANECGADLYVRIHAGSDTNGDLRGVRTLYPAGNEWVAGITAASRTAAREIQRSVVNMTGARDLGSAGRNDLAGFNWSRVPVVLVECGYLSNPIEDQRLATAAYRATVARGIAAGVLHYLAK
ncbi:N-acetylmuramoyl-L-alanine amidase [Coriobacteriia bacterium Es71-Z0120]|uniref:N-acetylmuramoyl-L-alanine amidase n=1 Tax=Parvivirga hydrogeniphila TaxID=2939460 RepID=UPI002260B9FD|nr:N-acetylmuramoyl-L-alanine amidase [Parvivirga hydrogeniphila]MCL4079018.1 N-acetylmuramoyl-L-alanine amidase [Parvivirga hydrogeniphila]